MSLMNDMLRDLEKRQAPERAQAAVAYGSLVEPGSGSGIVVKVVAILFGLALIAALVWWFAVKPEVVSSKMAGSNIDSQEQVATPVPNAHTSPPESATVNSDVHITTSIRTTLTKEKMADQEDVGGLTELPSSAVSMEKLSLEAVATAQKEAAKTIAEPDSKSAKVAVRPTRATRPDRKVYGPKVIDIEAFSKTLQVDAVEVPSQLKPELMAQHTKTVASAENIASIESVEGTENDNAATRPEVLSRKTNESVTAQRNKMAGHISKQVRLTPEQKDHQSAENALALIESGELSQALQNLGTYIDSNEVDVESRILLATEYVRTQNWKQAETLFDTPVLATNARLRQLKARTLAGQGQLGVAIKLLEESLPPVSENPSYHSLLASYYQQDQRSEEAIGVYARLIDYDADIADWWAGLGIALDKSGQRDSALQAYRRALSLSGLEPRLAQYIHTRLP